MKFIVNKLLLVLPFILLISSLYISNNYYEYIGFKEYTIKGEVYQVKSYLRVDDGKHSVALVEYRIPRLNTTTSTGLLLLDEDTPVQISNTSIEYCDECGSSIKGLSNKLTDKKITYNNKLQVRIDYTLLIINIVLILTSLLNVILLSLKLFKSVKAIPIQNTLTNNR